MLVMADEIIINEWVGSSPRKSLGTYFDDLTNDRCVQLLSAGDAKAGLG